LIGQKKAAEEGKPHDEIQEDSSKKTNDTKEKNTKTGDGKKEGFWRKTLRKMEGNW
jgi:hypothetical protein